MHNWPMYKTYACAESSPKGVKLYCTLYQGFRKGEGSYIYPVFLVWFYEDLKRFLSLTFPFMGQYGLRLR